MPTWRFPPLRPGADQIAVELRKLDEPKLWGRHVDFVEGAWPIGASSVAAHQSIAKAVGLVGAMPTVVDATAGLRRDAFVLASLGCKVTLIERSPVVAALLQDGLAGRGRIPR